MPRKTPDGPSIYPNCGDRSAYYRHLRNRTQPCRPCKDALAKAMRTYRYGSGLVQGRIIPLKVASAYIPLKELR